ncbi:MAG: glycoside hydrolase family 31 protein [Myxococcota bacterium]|jgi:hypothetical protein|nr:glycoside hydrolase family 31 protein [Myxococcota bacterium]
MGLNDGFWHEVILHTLLYPYLAELAEEAKGNGMPILRHPWLVEPDRPGLWSGDQYQFFLGEQLLVAPVLQQGATSRTVYLPQDGWWPLFGDAPLSGALPAEGGVSAVLWPAPVTELPVFVRPGTLLPLLAGPVDSFYDGASAPEVSTLASLSAAYRLALYPDAEGGLREQRVGSATVRGSKLSPDFVSEGLLLDGVALPVCATEPVPPCRSGNGEVFVEASNATLSHGESRLELVADSAQRYVIGVGGAAWGPWSEPTVVEQLDVQIAPPCMDE